MTARPPRQRAFDPALPPEGVRLRASRVASELGLSLAEMATHAGIGKTTLYRALSENRWPADKEGLQRRLSELLCERGATLDDLDTLWHAYTKAEWNAGYRTHQGKDYAFDASSATTVGINPLRQPLSAPEEAPEIEVLLPKQTLSSEARRAFKLLYNPFAETVQTDDQMYTNGEIAFVREAAWQAAVGARFIAVTGESGSGKTTIIEDLEARIEREHRQLVVIRPSILGMEDSDRKGHQLKSQDILAAIISTLQPTAVVPQTLEARSKRAAKQLGASIEAGYQHLLVIEEAHCLPDATLKHLKRLHELRVGRKPMLGILLVAQPELMFKLDPKRASLREVTQRCEVVQLMPLDGDLKPYLTHRARCANRALSEFIDDSGVEAIRARLTIERPGTGGKARTTSLVYPLAVNNWITAALNRAAELGAPIVTRDVVRTI